MSGILIILIAVIATAEIISALTSLFDLIESKQFTRQRDENEQNIIKIQQENLNTAKEIQLRVDTQNLNILKLTDDVNKVLTDFDSRIKALEETRK